MAVGKGKGVRIPITAVDKTRAVFKKISARMKSFGAGIGKIMKVAAIAVAALTTAFIALGKKAFDSMDAIQKTADRIGMSAEMLQALQFGAVESGTAIDKLRLGMEKFTKQLGDASMGIGTAKPILEKYGITIRDSTGELRSTEEVLFDVVDALGQTESSFEKNAVLMALFGRTGAQLNALLGQGRDVLDEVIDRYKRLGLAISKTTLDAVAKANDKWQEFISLGRALRDQFFGALAPAFTSLVDKLERMVIAQADARKGFEAWRKVLAVDFLETVKQTAGGILIVSSAIMNLSSGVILAIKSMLELQISLSGMWSTFQKFMLSGTGVGRWFAASAEGAALLDRSTVSLTDKLEKLGKSDFLNFDDLYEELNRLIELIKKPMVDVVDEVTTEFEKLPTVRERITGKIGGAVDTVTNQMTKAFTDFFNLTSDKFLDFGSLGKSILQMIITDLVKAWTIMNIMNPIRGFFGLPNVPGAQHGGTVTGGKPYIVGEAGAELFVPNQTGTIIPNNQLAGAGAGTNVNVSFNITAWDSRDATQAIAEQAPNIVAIVENSFRRRGQRLGGI